MSSTADRWSVRQMSQPAMIDVEIRDPRRSETLLCVVDISLDERSSSCELPEKPESAKIAAIRRE